MKHIELKAKVQTISGNAVFPLAFISQREISAYDLSNCYIPSKQCFEETRSFKEVYFPCKASTSTKKVVVVCKLVVAFELVKCFSGRHLFMKVGLSFKKCVIYNVHCILQCNTPVCFLYHGNIPSGRCCFRQGLNTYCNLKLQLFLNSLV